jgi:hypothetical protein
LEHSIATASATSPSNTKNAIMNSVRQAPPKFRCHFPFSRRRLRPTLSQNFSRGMPWRNRHAARKPRVIDCALLECLSTLHAEATGATNRKTSSLTDLTVAMDGSARLAGLLYLFNQLSDRFRRQNHCGRRTYERTPKRKVETTKLDARARRGAFPPCTWSSHRLRPFSRPQRLNL